MRRPAARHGRARPARHGGRGLLAAAVLREDTFPWSRSVELRLGLLAPDVVRDGAEFVREHYLDTCRRAEKLPSDRKKDARMREMFVLNLDWFMATLLEGSVAEG